MKTKEEKKKSNLWFMLFVLLLISAIMCISSFGIATWARYRSVAGGNVEAQIAKWSFKVNGEEEQFADINLADTISFEHVEKTTVAPGTYGSFDLDIDGRGSEVSLDYYIDMVVANKPTNLKFYTDSNHTQEIELITGNKMYLDGDLLLSENPMEEVRTIYWNWEYRTTTMPNQTILDSYASQIEGLEELVNQYENATEQQKQEIATKINDKIDTHEEGGQVTIGVTVKGIQINPNFSAKRIQITSSKGNTYTQGQTINFAIDFTENVYADDNQTAITNATAPQVTVGFETQTASNPVVKVASLMSTNLKLGVGENLATFVSVSGNKINYSYTLKSRDAGEFKVENITGKVYSSTGKEYDLGAKVPEIRGGTIVTDIEPIVEIQVKIDGEIISLTKETAPDYYGRVVTNYNQANATYRLFYVDFDGDFGEKGIVYLKADQVTTTKLSTSSSQTALVKMKQMNPQWRNNDGNANENNELAALRLYDGWTIYKDASKADYVIGAPSIEMYVKSYNAYHSKKGTSGYQKLNCKWFSSSVSGYKYALGDSVTDSSYVYYTDNNTLVKDENNMYVKSGENWWLASPSASGADRVCLVFGGNFQWGSYIYDYYHHGVSPLVSLKTDFIPELEVVPKIKVGGKTITLTKENVADYYGKVVTNYNQENATYRLFYVDFDGDFGAKGTVYLKADQVSTTALDTTASASSTEALNRMKQMNPDWAINDGIINGRGESGVLWLCDESMWSNYKDSSKADYVIGAPSIEMYVKSYNAYHSKKGTSGYQQLNCKWFDKTGSGNSIGYMYALGTNVSNSSYVYHINNNTLKADENNMYVKSGKKWWLASPSAYNNNYFVCYVNGENFCLSHIDGYNGSSGISPLVSLKTNFISEISN